MSFAAVHPASYRDPSGFIFRYEGLVYRQVNQVFKENYELFIESGLYDELVKEKLLLSHTALSENLAGHSDYYATLLPEQLSVITYPYEWCFDFFKEAALLTLTVAEKALQYGMMLKDASPFNVQFHDGRATFIDTLSFEKLDSTKPWIAYRQFCEMFFAPLALMNFLKTPLQVLLLAYPDGIPLSIAQKMLPYRSRFHVSTYLHVHLHAKIGASKSGSKQQLATFSTKAFQRILENLKNGIASFQLNEKTTWSDYYKEAMNRGIYVDQKKEIVAAWLAKFPQIKRALDAGANTGLFAELLAAKGIETIATDADHFAINDLYKRVKQNEIKNLVPVLMNLAQPSPGIGVNNEERASFINRFQSDLVLALALIHHLAIGHNIPFHITAKFFGSLSTYLIIEFVPKDDEKVTEMLKQKQDIYSWYTKEQFEQSFQLCFQILSQAEIKDSHRTLYLMKKHEA